MSVEILAPADETRSRRDRRAARRRRRSTSSAAARAPASAARAEGARLSTAKLTGIVFHEPAEMTSARPRGHAARARSRRALGAARPDAAVRADGPARAVRDEGEPTVGGLVATALAGPAPASAPARCATALIGLRLVNGRGEIVSSGGRVMKNVTGLDLVKIELRRAWNARPDHRGDVQAAAASRAREATVVIRRLDDARARRGDGARARLAVRRQRRGDDPRRHGPRIAAHAVARRGFRGIGRLSRRAADRVARRISAPSTR